MDYSKPVERERYLSAMLKRSNSKYAAAAVNQAFDLVFVSARSLQDRLHVSAVTAGRLIDAMERAGILELDRRFGNRQLWQAKEIMQVVYGEED